MAALKTHLEKALARRAKGIKDHHAAVHHRAQIAASAAELAAKHTDAAKVPPKVVNPLQTEGHAR